MSETNWCDRCKQGYYKKCECMVRDDLIAEVKELRELVRDAEPAMLICYPLNREWTDRAKKLLGDVK